MLDEPAAGLDAGEADALAEFTASLKAGGTSVLLIDHNMPLISRLCGRVYVIDAGRNLMDGSPAAAMADPRVLEVYLGTAPEESASSGAAAR
jgi:ABC-type branched-subunit amino acid transport system ATPase component